ncbi:MAG: tetratricopeptide repeat protein [Hydrococcus sp. C42_A2020_068]|nr:tetratricopeptide repeat protein [Hydrococcus sp. C42_A2020_068]
MDYKKIIALNPNDADSYYQVGRIYQEQEKFNEAIQYFQQSLALENNVTNSWNGLAYSLAKQGRLEEAIEIFDRLLEIEPDNIKCRWNCSLTFLKKGDFKKGLPDFECRKHLPNFHKSYLGERSMWDGSDLNRKTILLHNGDDGFGDIIQLIRYAPLVAQKGGRVIFACPKPLFRLFGCISGIDRLVILEDKLPDTDVYLPLLSLLYYLGTTLETIPAKIPYINLPKNDQWKDGNLPIVPQGFPKTRFKIGIVWSSGHRER